MYQVYIPLINSIIHKHIYWKDNKMTAHMNALTLAMSSVTGQIITSLQTFF